jgi:hypothetical protein
MSKFPFVSCSSDWSCSTDSVFNRWSASNLVCSAWRSKRERVMSLFLSSLALRCSLDVTKSTFVLSPMLVACWTCASFCSICSFNATISFYKSSILTSRRPSCRFSAFSSASFSSKRATFYSTSAFVSANCFLSSVISSSKVKPFNFWSSICRFCLSPKALSSAILFFCGCSYSFR